MVEYKLKIFNEKKIESNNSQNVIGIDIGGTNTNIGISSLKDKKINPIFSFNFKTEKIKSIIPLINKTTTYAKDKYDINVDLACIAAAGVVLDEKDRVKLTNSSLEINLNEIKKNTSLNDIYIINDFQAIGYGINLLDHNNEKDMRIIKNNNLKKHKNFSTKAIIGAGTGLGKGILIYNQELDYYTPIPSEGGHSDFPYQNDFEKKIVNYIKNKRNIKQPLTYEEVISGRGIEGIYDYLNDIKKYKPTDYTKKISNSNDKAKLISKYKNKDKTCRETFKIFTKFYARCAKNFALDTLSIDGLYIAGGIVSKNVDSFKSKEFIKEFEKSYRRLNLLKKIPIYAIMNYNVSLFGSCFAAIHKKNLEDKNG